MAKQLLAQSIQAPGFYGINRQDAAIGLSAGFALSANNCVIDKYGRMGARKGWAPMHSTLAATGGQPFKAIFELVTDNGITYIIGAANNKLFKLASGVLTELTYGGGGTTPTITADNWQAASLSDALWLYQEGHDPLIFDPTVSTTTYKRISEVPGYLGTAQKSNCVISAYGRIWSASTDTEKQTIQFSDILAGQVLSGGSSGTLNVNEVWPNGGDIIVALAAHNNFLYVFGRKQILVYQNANDPSTMSLADAINGVGCVARDSVVNTGTDIIFLSDSGVRSLLRTVQEKSAPMRELSLNVRDDLINYLRTETDPAKDIKAGWSPVDAHYTISFPTSNVVYVFDTRGTLENGAARTTTWTDITPTAYLYTSDKQLLIGKEGFIGEYTGYADNGSTYRMYYYTNYIDFGQPTTLKLLKAINVVFVGTAGSDLAIKYAFDYSDYFRSQTATLSSETVSYFGIAEYNVGVFTTGITIDTKKVNAGGSGTILQLGIEVDINGNELSIQKIDCYSKAGRTI